MNTIHTICIVDDDEEIRSLLSDYLRRNGFSTCTAGNAAEFLEIQRRVPCSLIVMDIMLPGMDGLEILRRLREGRDTADVPVIMLTARTQEMDKVTGLMTGADDYVTKPFSPAELTARVDALLRRAGDAPLVSAAVGEISQPPFLLNMTDRVVEKNGKRLRLTQLEYQIMKLFMENPDKALTREEILDTVWGRGYFGEVKIVDVNIRRLRLKIEDDAQEPRYIATVWGTGYKWSTD